MPSASENVEEQPGIIGQNSIVVWLISRQEAWHSWMTFYTDAVVAFTKYFLRVKSVIIP